MLYPYLVLFSLLSLGGIPERTPPIQSVQYTVVDLGTLPGDAYSVANAVNNRGQVTGTSATADGKERAFLYDGGPLHDLGSLGGGYSYGNAINNRGQVCGKSTGRTFGNNHAFLYSGGALKDLGQFPPPNPAGYYGVTVALGINDNGDITGLDGGYYFQRVFLYSHGKMRDLGKLIKPSGTGKNNPHHVVGYQYSFGQAINNRGQITGAEDDTATGHQQAFFL